MTLRLPKDDFKAIFMSISNEKKNSKVNYIKANDIQVEEMNINRLLFPIIGHLKIYNNIKKINPNIIHSHLLRADYINAYIKLDNISRVTTLHNQPYTDYSYTYGKYIGYLSAFMHIKFINNISNIVACSKYINSFYSKKIKKSIKTIQVGVRTELFSPANCEEKIILRTKLKLEKNAIIFIVLGNIIPRKNIITIINAFEGARLPKNVILLIAGDGEDRTVLESRKYSKNIKFLGKVEDAREYLVASDFYISASLSEGLPASVIEAMSCGLPVILSDIPSHREIFENEKYSLFFNSLNSLELKNILENINSKDVDYISNLVKNIVNKKFNYQEMAKKYIELYRSFS